MNKILVLLAFLSTALGAPQAVVFDWGGVLANEDRNIVVNFMCQSLDCSVEEFEAANLEKRKAVKEGKSDSAFWLEHAKQKGIELPSDWSQCYVNTLKESVGADPEMFALIDKLKTKGVRVALLSNIDTPYTKLIRGFGFYQPFDPCLLSCEIGLRKPNPEAYESLISALQLSAEEIVFIDDKKANVEAAQKLGIDAILFQSAEQIKEELAKRDL